LINHTNLEIKDTACFHVVHIVQHQTFCPTTTSTDDTMVNAPMKNLLPDLVGNYRCSTKFSNSQYDHANDGNHILQTESARALAAWHSLHCKKPLSAEKSQELHFFGNQEKQI